MKIVRAIRAGRIVPKKPVENEQPRFYSIWSNDDTPIAPHPMHMPAPKLKLPSHNESYNPPAEYLFSEEEKKEWEAMDDEERKGKIEPKKYSTLRHVPAYDDFVSERFERCLDLYLAPRTRRRRPLLDIQGPEDLLDKLPSPKELRPFPTFCGIRYHHPGQARTRCISIDPSGSWIATGSEDGHVRIWNCELGRCAWQWNAPSGSAREKGPVYSVEWCPDPNKLILAVATYVYHAYVSVKVEFV